MRKPPDLFRKDTASQEAYQAALSAWLDATRRAGILRRPSSVAVYRHMWSGFTEWSVTHGYGLDAHSTDALAAFLASRNGPDDLSDRYAWRMLRLIDRVLSHRSESVGVPANPSAAVLLDRRPELRFANAQALEPLPDFLPAAEARDLVVYLSAVRTTPLKEAQGWQDARNRSAVALMLGAGLTPGEIRALKLADVVTDGGRRAGVAWQLHVGGNGNAPARETPVAMWSGKLLSRWLALRRSLGIPGAMVFPSTRATGKPWGKVSQYKAAKSVLAAAGIDSSEGGSFRLRHTFALRQLRRGRSSEEVGRWLGVSDPAVMARYRRVIAATIEPV